MRDRSVFRMSLNSFRSGLCLPQASFHFAPFRASQLELHAQQINFILGIFGRFRESSDVNCATAHTRIAACKELSRGAGIHIFVGAPYESSRGCSRSPWRLLLAGTWWILF